MKKIKQLLERRIVKAGDEELIKARVRERGEDKILANITARLDVKTGNYVATIQDMNLDDVSISSELVKRHERLLNGGFWAVLIICYDVDTAQKGKGRPFYVKSLEEIQPSNRNLRKVIVEGRKKFSTQQWKIFLLRSIGIEADGLPDRAVDTLILRMVPFVERNYNMIEIGPRATGKTYFYQQISPHSHLVAGGKASVADLFVNHNNLQRGLVCRYDVVVIDEVSKLCYVEDYGISVMKTYMESGEFSRGKMNIKAEGSFVMLGNLADDLYHQQEGDPFSTLPSAIRDDTAFMDRIHACVPGWYIPKFRGMRTDHYGLVRNVIAELFRQLRTQNVIPYLEKNVVYGTALTGRDINAVNKTASGLIKIIHPFIDPANVPPEDIEWAVRIAMAARLLVKEQQKRKNESEFGDTYFSFHLGSNPTQFVSAPELPGDERNESDPLPPLPACS